MSIITSGPFGKVKGHSGNYNFRVQNDQTIMSIRPGNFKVSQSESSVKNRDDFSFCSRPLKELRKITVLYNWWKSSSVKGRYVSNKQLHINRALIKSYEDLNNIVLAPSENYTEVTALSIIAEAPVFKLTVNPIPGGVSMKRAYASAQGLLILAEPKLETDPVYQFIPLTSAMSELQQGLPQTFDLEPPQWIVLNEYKKIKVILNLAVYNKMGNAVELSTKLIGDFDF